MDMTLRIGIGSNCDSAIFPGSYLGKGFVE